jgi:predicted MFS family arabinose efflux permease
MAEISVEHFGWQRTLIFLGLLQIVICAPLHFFGLPKIPAAPAKPQDDSTDFTKWLAEIRREISDNRFLGVALWFPAHTAAFSGLTFLLIPFLQSRSVKSETMLVAIALIGPMQVIGRLFLVAHVGQYSTTRIGAYALSALGLALLILITFPPTAPTLICFAILYGSGNGVMTILRGTVISELFGPARYAELNGALAAPTVFAQALSPFILSTIWNASGRESSVVISAFVLIVFAELGRRKTLRAINSAI